MPSQEVGEWTRAWKPDLSGIEEVFHARFREHHYPPHAHSTWTVMALEAGTVDYRLDGRRRIADRTSITVLPPFVAHDGKSANAGESFVKRVLYLSEPVIPPALTGRAVHTPSFQAVQLRCDLGRLHATLSTRGGDLEADELLVRVVDQIRQWLGGSPDLRRPTSHAAVTLREYLDQHLFERQDLQSIAEHLGWDARHLIRSFGNTFGVTPHRYLIGRRIEAARGLLLSGVPAACVAAEVGFFDQAHLTRHFKTATGVTPGRFGSSRVGRGADARALTSTDRDVDL